MNDKTKNGKANGKVSGKNGKEPALQDEGKTYEAGKGPEVGKAPEEGKVPDTGKAPEDGKTGGSDAKAKGTGKAKAEPKAEKGSKAKVTPFEKKPIPEAVKGLVTEIGKLADLEHLKAVARELKKHWKKIYGEACKKATEGLTSRNVVWFKNGSKLIEGKVVKVKTSGKVKIETEDGKVYRVPGLVVHKGHPTGEDRAQVTKKAA